MAATLNNAAVFQNHDTVRVLNGAEAVRNNKRSTAVHKGIHALLYQLFGSAVNGRSSFVQNQNRRICYRCAGNGNQLALPLRQVGPVIGQLGLITIRQRTNEFVRIGQRGSRNTFFICGIQSAIPDIFHNGIRKQVGILQYHTKGPAQIRFFDLVDIDIVIADFTVLNIIKAVNQVGNGGLTGTGGPDKGNLLSRFGKHADVMQYNLIFRVPEVHVIKDNVALHRVQRNGAVLVRMLPGPGAGAFFTFHQAAMAVISSIDQFYISVVLFRLLVQKLKNTLCAGQTHHNGVHLGGQLTDRRRKALIQCQERNQGTNGQSIISAQCQNAADNST